MYLERAYVADGSTVGLDARFDRAAWMKHNAAIHPASSANSVSAPASTSGRQELRPQTRPDSIHPASTHTTPTARMACASTLSRLAVADDLHTSPSSPLANAPMVAPTIARCGICSGCAAPRNPMNAPTAAPTSAKPP